MSERGGETWLELGQGDELGTRPAPGTVLQGTVSRVTYHDEESLYTVLRVQPERGYGDPEELIPGSATAVGRSQAPAAGLRVRLSGTWSRHPTHGRQFAFDQLEALPPADAEGLVRYLSSDVFQGVGETLARRIVDKLGTGALGAIQADAACLAGIRGLRAEVAERVAATVRAELGTHQLRAFLLGLGLGPWQAAEVLSALGPECEERLRADPYLLAESVKGLGFHTADRAARSLGLAADSPQRLRAALLHVLRAGAGEGHSLLRRGRLVAEALELLREDVEREPLEAELETLAREGRVVVEEAEGATDANEAAIYLPRYHVSEVGLARHLKELLAAAPLRPLATADALRRAEARAGLELHDLQREAVLGLLSHPVALLTGGPGVGKTTIVRLVVELAEAAGARVVLASPTGRAAKRLAEATDREASTVHRLLGWDPQKGGFARGGELPLEADLVVVDELSMLDVALAHHLLKAVQPPTRLVLVGDPDQLPSVQPGNVLADLIDSGAIPTWRLTQIFRQQAGSLIVANAHRILRGEMLAFPDTADTEADCFFFPADSDEACADRVVEVVTERIPRRFGLDWARDVQVLAPMYKGACGVDALNERLRDALDAGGRELLHRGRVWREGDRVIHTRNDYEREVFNGDMGRVSRVAPDGSGLEVRFPERVLFYTPAELGDLQPAFAITVHRSQGGEYPAVVMPLVARHFVMLRRHLLYTAVTRARRLLVLVGSRRALQMAIDNEEEGHRESGLAARLREEPATR